MLYSILAASGAVVCTTFHWPLTEICRDHPANETRKELQSEQQQKHLTNEKGGRTARAYAENIPGTKRTAETNSELGESRGRGRTRD